MSNVKDFLYYYQENHYARNNAPEQSGVKQFNTHSFNIIYLYMFILTPLIVNLLHIVHVDVLSYIF